MSIMAVSKVGMSNHISGRDLKAAIFIFGEIYA